MYLSTSKTGSWGAVCSIFLVLDVIMITGACVVAGDSLDTDREVLLSLKAFLQQKNRVNQGIYAQWNQRSSNPCEWLGISCSNDRKRVSRVELSDQKITGEIFRNFSALTALSYLDLSKNTISGALLEDLSQCHSLRHLNLSHNIIDGELNLNGLNQLEVLDLTVNRFYGDLKMTFPGVCSNLVVANLSANNFTGRIDNLFDECFNLQYLDLSSNYLSGEIWSGFIRLTAFSVSENYFSGAISPSVFTNNCSLVALDLSVNSFSGAVPANISKCQRLIILNLWGNHFTGPIPSKIGSILGLQGLFLGNNSFSRDIPESLLDLSSLTFLDLSRNNFRGKIQDIFGRFRQVKFILLHSNGYTGGIHSSGILKLPNVSRLDLSHNNFTGPLPLDISLPKLKLFVLAFNQFNGTIPPGYGNISTLQALDLSFNSLTGAIPSTLGNLSSLLWLMLANNSLTGPIPHELGNCSSLLWLNLANNKLSGPIPSQLTMIGRNVQPTFDKNIRDNHQIIAGSGECLAMRRWIPADYPPFNFVYTILTRKNCRSIWDRLLKGNGLFPICAAGSYVRTLQISGYVQLSGNQLSGQLPADIGTMSNFSMINLGVNRFQGELPANIGQLPLVVFNISRNNFSGQIPGEIGNIKCMQNLDMSYNNFSGTFPLSLNGLNELSKFNISYNPLISGIIPSSGQLATFEKDSYLGNPLLQLPEFIDNSTYPENKIKGNPKKPTKSAAHMVHSYSERAGHSPQDADILNATRNFSEDRIIGSGGFGTVYQGVLQDGRVVAVKKLQREGLEGEREFRAEMEVLSGNGFGWPHPNLVTLHGWCLYGSEKILVYEYMEGGTLEDLISDRVRLTWRRRVDVAVDVARALVFLHHECFPAIVHRDVKASNVLLDKDGKARVTDFGLARIVDAGDSHVSTMVAGTVGYVAPEYGQTWQATTKGDVYSYGVLAMELATGRRAVDGGEECLVEWARRVMGNGRQGFNQSVIPVMLMGSGLADGAEEMCELLKVGIKCAAEAPQSRPNMKEVLAMLLKIYKDENIYSLQSN
ncbi:hypothetical protein C1H46_035260 [Malus baccata]|uniref:non-specific serine/threonine protein kinase n=1 Tax=Malus baccata TaxID=106549 RepID=A0A540KYY7_MALBA|nr:hypothetical protein C1H46_035260 [Malus baccata]